MTKKSKKALFYSAVAVFLLLSYIVIMYAQGYKYSFSENKFLRTGAISLRVNTGAKIFIDDKLEGDTSFFNNSYSIDRLLPDTYTVNIQKVGYSSWHKTAKVEEGYVIDFPRIMLLPEEGDEEQKLFDEVDLLFKELLPIPTITLPILSPKNTQNRGSSISNQNRNDSGEIGTTPDASPFLLDTKTGKLYQNNDQKLEEIASNVKGFRISENKNKLAWWTANELWVLWLNDQNYQPSYKKGDKELITRLQLTIQDGAWFRDEDHVIIELERFDSKNRPYFIYRVVEIDKRGGVNIVEL